VDLVVDQLILNLLVDQVIPLLQTLLKEIMVVMHLLLELELEVVEQLQ
jgi:hypothetical protein|tara:strand:- start:121 stop:264 length:144 start_codon:yes stop_codon:yes gene_type:complete